MGKATEDLRQEHDSILHVLKLLDHMKAAPSDEEARFAKYGQVVYFLKIFADKCHHGKEEGYLFPELVSKGIAAENGPVGVMLQEHGLGRDYTAAMSQAVEAGARADFEAAAAGYADLLRKHIDKENQVLFALADKLISDAQQDKMFEQFERFEESVIGHGIHEQLHAMIHGWQEELEHHR